MTKRYKCRPLSGGLCVARFTNRDERWQLLLTKPGEVPEDRYDWVSFKLEAEGYVDHKAAYWFDWSISQARYGGKHSSAGVLERYRPELYKVVCEAIKLLIADEGDPRLLTSYSPVPEYAAIYGNPRHAADCQGLPETGCAAPDSQSLAIPGNPLILKGVAGDAGDCARDQNDQTLGESRDPDEDLL